VIGIAIQKNGPRDAVHIVRLRGRGIRRLARGQVRSRSDRVTREIPPELSAHIVGVDRAVM